MRHSHSPEGEIPSDLHVLGLPLAFILSQDQTLHCIIVVLVVFLLGLRYDLLLFLTLETEQPSGHCPIFLTAASRRSLDRVSVPVWGTNLSVPLDIAVLVGRYPAN